MTSLLETCRAWLNRPPVTWPRFVDHAGEWWWTQSSRVRLVLPLIAIFLFTVSAGTTFTKETTTTVVIALRDIPPGTLITPDDVATEQWPRRFVPESWTLNAEGVALSFIAQGSVLTRHHLGDGGVSLHLPNGQVAVAVPIGVLPPVSLGDTLTFVDVNYDGEANAFTHMSTVIHTDDDVLWFAVAPNEAARVTAAAQSGRIGVIVHPRVPVS